MNQSKPLMDNIQKSMEAMADSEIKTMRDKARLELMHRGLHDIVYESGVMKPNLRIIHTTWETIQ